MDLVARINAAISHLEDAREDALKVESGKTGAAGTRVRKAAQEVKVLMGDVRKDVIAARKA
jgi:hypothetical protein